MDTEIHRQIGYQKLDSDRSVSIFIKTCKKDLKWLEHCLRSADEFTTGFQELIIVADDDCYGEEVLNGRNVHYCNIPKNGYMHQQGCKLDADLLTKSDFILFIDSDCVFNKLTSPDLFWLNDRLVLPTRQYSSFAESEPVYAWKAITEQYTSWPVPLEYMARMPIIHSRMVLEKIRESHPTLSRLAKITKFGMFRIGWRPEFLSEFNLMGAFAHHYFNDSYEIMDITDPRLPESTVTQYWSWGDINQILKG